MSCSVTARAADRPLHVEQPAFRLAAGEIDGDGAQPRVGHVLGLADGGADGALGVLDIGDAAAAHARGPSASRSPARAACRRFPRGRSGRRSWWCRCRARRTAPDGACRARAGGSIRLDVCGGSTRRDMSFIRPPRSGRFLDGPSPACPAVSDAVSGIAAGPPAGRAGAGRSPAAGGRAARAAVAAAISRSSAGDLGAFRQHHVGAVVHPQVPAPLADPHRGDHACPRLPGGRQRIDQRRRAAGAPGPTTSGNWRELGDVLIRHRSAPCGRSARSCPGSARSRTAAAPAAAPRWCRAGAARRSHARTQ